MPKTLEFWFDFSCPFAYLASTKVEALAARVGAALEVRPMLLGGVFKARGVAQNLAATLGPAKARHNLDDIRRGAQRAGVPLRMPAGHPLRTVEALRVVLAAGAPMPLIHRIYRAYWVDGAELGALARWRPILLGGLFRSIGTPDVPLLHQSEAKRNHTMADLLRQAERAGVPFRFPSFFPVRTVLPLRVTLAAGTPPALVRALARALWGEERDISDPAVVAGICDSLGLPGAELLARAETPEIKAALHANNAAAEAAGAFGVPTFVVHTTDHGPQLYWGADRLALAAAASAGDASAI